MTRSPNLNRSVRLPAEVIEHAVWLHHPFSLSPRDGETILAARGVVVCYEGTHYDLRLALRRLVLWIAERHPEVDGFEGRWCIFG